MQSQYPPGFWYDMHGTLPDKSLSNSRTLLKNSKQYVNHIDAHISFIICPVPYPNLVLKGTLSELDILYARVA